MKLKVDLDRITLDDVIALEEKQSAKSMKFILARFVINEAGEYMPTDEAIKAVGALTMRELRDVSSQFAEAMKGAQSEAVPPTGSGR
jgi:hypothetical protein